MQNGKKFAALGLQIAAGVPLQCDEGPDYRSFRLGLFGLDKLYDVDASVARLEAALDKVFAQRVNLAAAGISPALSIGPRADPCRPA